MRERTETVNQTDTHGPERPGEAPRTVPPVTTEAVKRRVVWAATELLKRAGMDVVKSDTGTGCTLTVTIPPDTGDLHGDRLRAVRAQAT